MGLSERIKSGHEDFLVKRMSVYANPLTLDTTILARGEAYAHAVFLPVQSTPRLSKPVLVQDFFLVCAQSCVQRVGLCPLPVPLQGIAHGVFQCPAN